MRPVAREVVGWAGIGPDELAHCPAAPCVRAWPEAANAPAQTKRKHDGCEAAAGRWMPDAARDMMRMMVRVRVMCRGLRWPRREKKASGGQSRRRHD
jgi:hypothetical protein